MDSRRVRPAPTSTPMASPCRATRDGTNERAVALSKRTLRGLARAFGTRHPRCRATLSARCGRQVTQLAAQPAPQPRKLTASRATPDGLAEPSNQALTKGPVLGTPGLRMCRGRDTHLRSLLFHFEQPALHPIDAIPSLPFCDPVAALPRQSKPYSRISDCRGCVVRDVAPCNGVCTTESNCRQRPECRSSECVGV